MSEERFRHLEDLKEDFFSFESETSLFDLRINGFPVWESIRFNFYQDLVRYLGFRGDQETNTRDSLDLKTILKVVYLCLINLFYKNPLFASKTDLVFFGHRRRKKDDSGNYEDIYCDPIISSIDFDYLYLEEPYNYSHKPTKASNVRRLDFPRFVPRILYRIWGEFYSFKDSKVGKIKQIEKKAAQRYGKSLNFNYRARKTAFTSSIELKLYKLILRKLDPDLAIFVVSYGREAQIKACQDLGIKTVELQHSIINRGHIGYNYPGGKENFPDYLFTFGDYWKDAAAFPIKDSKIISVGYPYLEREISKYENLESKNQVLFLSQPTIGSELSKIATELLEKSGKFEIVYKLHPAEYDVWKDQYPWLVESDIKVIDSDTKSLYRLFAESKTQVGVYSTAVYEGMAAGLETFIMDLSGSHMMEDLIEEEGVSLVSNVEELSESIKLSKSEINPEKFFKQSSKENFSKEIKKLIRN